MKTPNPIVFLLLTMILAGCSSGFTVAQFGDGKLISYEELRKYDGGSLSTVWYRGSDDDFHYFSHYIKTSTKYKVKRDEIEIKNEFPKGTNSVHLMEANGEMEKLRDRMREIKKENSENQSVHTTRAKRPSCGSSKDVSSQLPARRFLSPRV